MKKNTKGSELAVMLFLFLSEVSMKVKLYIEPIGCMHIQMHKMLYNKYFHPKIIS